MEDFEMKNYDQVIGKYIQNNNMITLKTNIRKQYDNTI